MMRGRSSPQVALFRLNHYLSCDDRRLRPPCKDGIPYREFGITAVDAYCGFAMRKPVKFILIEGSIVDLARCFETLDYPALPYAGRKPWRREAGYEARFLCAESILKRNLGAVAFTDFRRNPADGHFYDPLDVYSALRSRNFRPVLSGGGKRSLRVCRLSFPIPGGSGRFPAQASLSGKGFSALAEGPAFAHPPGLQLLRIARTSQEKRFYQDIWPDLDALLQVDHAKDCHPEGGGWSHTMEALGHRKSFDLTLSLAILLHDIGKPRSESSEGRRFDKHAEIGAKSRPAS